MKIVKLTDGNGDVVYKVKPSGFWSIFNAYYWSDGELGLNGQNFTLDEARRFIKSFDVVSEEITNVEEPSKKLK
jgi:hypothetical protein